MNAQIAAWGPEPPLFVRLLAAEVAASNKTKASQRIGMSRTAVSLVLANRYASPSTAGVERRVMETLGRIQCVALDSEVTVDQCQSYREKPAPTHNPQAMQHWRACQYCSINPDCCNQENVHARLQ
ncbi:MULTISPECIES: hypothetical protein [Pseudomonas]|uniref:hypothetical protein n=1 Tax=Pseudomonas TaxID=286 RepID=UPI001F20F2BC|nr:MULTISPECIES: hypothetical protein [Pseudomonas]MCF6763801.1 hypothetical protein [Pseudomonas fragi]